MDERGFEEGCPQNRVVFEGAVPERMRFWAREWVVSGRDGAAGDCGAMVQGFGDLCSNGAVLLLKMNCLGWRCYMECGIFVATVFGMCWRFGCEGA